MSRYRLAEPIPDTLSDTFGTYSPLVKQLFYARGLTQPDEVESFVRPDYEAGLHDPGLLHDMAKAVARIESAMAADEKIAIYSDYDCDGIPGGVVLHDFFKAIGYENFINYIPHRHFEGFGLNNEALKKLKGEGVSLIITIDCGTGDTEQVAVASELGVDVIITDHHEPGAELPVAYAIVNPKLGSYPFTELCGAAVVFKLVQALIKSGEYDLKEGFEKWWLDMVGVATIADMVPLTGENRVLAHYGLKVLRKSRRPGLQQLLKKTRVKQQYLSEDDIGFSIGPRINAASRMDDPEDAFYILSTTDETEAAARVDHLEKLNTERKTSIALITKDLHKRLKKLNELPSVLVFGSPEWRPALVGLAANKLSEEYSRPVFLWGRDGNGAHKGSARSGGGVSVVRLMEKSEAVFLEYGGHHMSGGFTVLDDHIFTFGDALNEAFQELGEAASVDEEMIIDADLSIDTDLRSLLRELRIMAPFGLGNPKPLFRFTSVTPEAVEQFGKTKEHLRLTFTTLSGKLEAIAFFATPQSYTKLPAAGKSCTLLGQVEESFFMNRLQTRLRIVDII